MRVGVGVATGRFGGDAARCGGTDEEGDGTLAEVGLAHACGAGVHEKMGLRMEPVVSFSRRVSGSVHKMLRVTCFLGACLDTGLAGLHTLVCEMI